MKTYNASKLKEELLKEFENEFLYVDHGPSGDDHDANLPCWSEWFNDLKTDIERDKDWEQIEQVKRFLSKALERVRQESFREGFKRGASVNIKKIK